MYLLILNNLKKVLNLKLQNHKIRHSTLTHPSISFFNSILPYFSPSFAYIHIMAAAAHNKPRKFTSCIFFILNFIYTTKKMKKKFLYAVMRKSSDKEKKNLKGVSFLRVETCATPCVLRNKKEKKKKV